MYNVQRIFFRPCKQLTNIHRLSTKVKNKIKTKTIPAVNTEIPQKLLNKKLKTPDSMYIINEIAANIIDESIEPFLSNTQCKTAIEINPGLGLFTKKLLDREKQFDNILLFESTDEFLSKQEELHVLYPERVKVKRGDFVNLSKIVYQDKMDNGTRTEELLEHVPKMPYNEGINARIFGVVGSYNFFKSLINFLVFQNGLIAYGRYELFVVMPPPIYIHLTCSGDLGYMFYRATSILFQILFEYQYITKIPREYFIPPESQSKMNPKSKLHRVNSINTDYLYLVKISPRQNLNDFCSIADLPAMWYFIKQNCVSRRNRVVPNLEKWIPGCGIRVIADASVPERIEFMYPNEDTTKLPEYTNRCTTMHCRDFHQNTNIYTQFGDLSGSQILALFTQFRNWPEYNECPFTASLESWLIKMNTTDDDSAGGIDISEEDDMRNDLMELDNMSYEQETDKKSAGKTKNTINL
ncbi:dimethyladenosine transferase 2, mitochondrial-like [Teleopsis dalmanni]|uniref:dimethyladenosine transferase 2, mitochondrial-like n=1 Tax=Teleopsis dalmanni TaxID=139649 RepID=UPI0018CE1476|nr:dimethyladenosine transferase 2, mitochondrial-like [Teleopsis dalmanni]